MAQALPSDEKSPETLAHVVAMLRDFDTATLVTRCRGGSLHGRPMHLASVDDDATIWFITSVRSTKADEVAEDSRAMVTLQGDSRFLCLNGNVELVFDPERIKALWNDSHRSWYRGAHEPDVVLLRFRASDAEYWDRASRFGARYASQAARTLVNGRGADRERSSDAMPQSHAKLALWGTRRERGARSV